MNLYFLRHGIAEDAVGNMSDDQRQLTPEGVKGVQQAAKVVKVLDLHLSHVYSSPLTRAQQTAAVIGKALGVAVELRKEISPGFSARAVEALTRDLVDDDAVMFVGHEPDFSETIRELTGGRVVVKKGGLARVEVTTRQPLVGELVWLIAPKVFEALT